MLAIEKRSEELQIKDSVYDDDTTTTIFVTSDASQAGVTYKLKRRRARTVLENLTRQTCLFPSSHSKYIVTGNGKESHQTQNP